MPTKPSYNRFHKRRAFRKKHGIFPEQMREKEKVRMQQPDFMGVLAIIRLLHDLDSIPDSDEDGHPTMH